MGDLVLKSNNPQQQRQFQILTYLSSTMKVKLILLVAIVVISIGTLAIGASRIHYHPTNQITTDHTTHKSDFIMRIKKLEKIQLELDERLENLEGHLGISKNSHFDARIKKIEMTQQELNGRLQDLESHFGGQAPLAMPIKGLLLKKEHQEKSTGVEDGDYEYDYDKDVGQYRPR